MDPLLDNLHVTDLVPLISPDELKEKYPIQDSQKSLVLESRRSVQDIVHGRDSRFLCIVGPCSIHDVTAAKEYAQRLAELRERYKDRLCIVMRSYFEKPRTTIGWKGLINDPDLNGESHINEGLEIARELLLSILDSGMPVACEMLDTMTPQYYADLVSWGSIGARTTESQPHREMTSGLSMPVGFKNGTDGNITVAVNGIQSSNSPHSFVGLGRDGQISIVRTEGNPDTHIILRGGSEPNYDKESIDHTVEQLQAAGLNSHVLVDCSHGNSKKKHENQIIAARDVVAQRRDGNHHVVGIMVESNLKAGKQSFSAGEDKSKLEYGQSITDACIGWDDTEALLSEIYQSLSDSI